MKYSYIILLIIILLTIPIHSLNKTNDTIKKGQIWNLSLTIISIFNIILITYYFFLPSINTKHKHLTILVMIYVYVCAIRAIWPRIEDGLCFHDNIISKPIIGRTLATIAELSFAMFLVMLTHIFLLDSQNITKNTSIKHLITLNNVIFVLIIFAQIFCWFGVITNRPEFNIIEESLWGILSFEKILIYSILLYIIYKYNNPKIKFLKNLLPCLIIIFFLYFLYMIFLDIPMYYKKSIQNNKHYNIIDGLKELCFCKNITKSFEDWKQEIIWLTGYFTFAVWFCISLLFLYHKYLKLN